MVLVLGLPGNAVIIKAYAWKKRKTSTDILIMAQAIVDFVACVFSPAFIIRSAFPGLTTENLCKAASLAENTTAFASLYLTTAISIDRYMAVCRPLRRRMTLRMSICIAILCTVVSTVSNIPAAVFTEARHFRRLGRSLCFVYGSYVFGSTISSLVLFAVSLMTNTVLYALIYVSLRKRAKIHADMTGKHPAVATVSTRNARDYSGGLQDSSPRENHMIAAKAKTEDRTSTFGVTSIENKVKTDEVLLHSETAGCSSNITLSSSPRRRSRPSGSHVTCAVTETSRENQPSNTSQGKILSSLASSTKMKAFERQGTKRIQKLKNNKESDYGRKTTRMLLIITIFFFVTWTPKVIVPIIPRKAVLRASRIPGYFTIIQIFYALRLLNHIVNFFVYYLVNNSFRRDVKESCKHCRCSQKLIM
ncbi:cholecystokinin receptor type A-like [Strongylocentrotus purpuratus]|uniref:G-protein coupled receptors family 1 profile domain-containing protein n=1 Tax=Strongylocentrotus purpuratus TaxID=7668 RepID=A0A7M7NZJ7_STRPU|nr:cholecystokinin receptor type A-like [Strongylocentrotus purpuratus]